MNMTNKTPYELRLELLQLAQSILNDKNWAERQRLENDWNVDREVYLSKAMNSKEATLPAYPTMPTISSEDIVAEAKKLNDFVSNG